MANVAKFVRYNIINKITWQDDEFVIQLEFAC